MRKLALVAICVTLCDISFALTAEECYNGLVALNIKLGDYERYPEFFQQDSRVVIAEGGEFIGYTGIKQYAAFGGIDSPYLAAEPINSEIYQVNFDDSAGTCTFLVLGIAKLTTNPDTATPTRVHRVKATKITYDANHNYVPEIGMYLPKQFIRTFYGEVLGGAKTRQYICRTLIDNCEMVHIVNDLPSQSECEAELVDLPPLSRNFHFDGDDRACRTLHAPSAALETRFCAPLSFAAEVDHDGRVKCQHSAGITASQIFTTSDLAMLERYSEKNGIDPSVGFVLVCENDARWSTEGTTEINCAWIADDPSQRCLLGDAKYACARSCHPQCTGVDYFEATVSVPARTQQQLLDERSRSGQRSSNEAQRPMIGRAQRVRNNVDPRS